MNRFVKKIFIALADIFAIVMSSFFALLLTYNFDISAVKVYSTPKIYLMTAACALVSVGIFELFHLYQSVWTYASMIEATNVAIACLIISVIKYIVFHIPYPKIPFVFYLLNFFFNLMFIIFIRFFYRLLRVVLNVVETRDEGRTKVMIVGAGSAGNTIIHEITSNKESKLKVCCVVDDNKNKKGNYICGCKIEGNRNDIVALVKKHSIKEIIIAMPSAPKSELKEIVDICQQTECKIRILPSIYKLANGEANIAKVRDVEIEDLLGRDPIHIDNEETLEYIKGKTVLVTGGGGSIGSELCRQLASHPLNQLIIVDIYENNAYDIQMELKEKYPYLDLVVLIASVRDEKRLCDIFEKYKPDIVYHAAAHKHVPLMEDSPNEAIKNNVLGTLNLVRTADKYGVKRFVMISTDKAVNPTNIMGATKRICEMIVQTYNKRSNTEFVAVRFGNVLGSNGSVIPLFKKQIQNGGPVSVTHPDIIRYFMTIPEAVSLVIQAGGRAKGGEIFVLDMGKPVKILDLAENLIRLSGYTPGKDIKIEFTGLRPGEKLYEELLMGEEGLKKTDNDLIYIGEPIEVDENKLFEGIEKLRTVCSTEAEGVYDLVHDLVPTFTGHPH